MSYSPVILMATIFQVHLIRGDLEFRVICSFRNLEYKKDTDVIKKGKINRWLFLLPNLLGVAIFALIPMLEVLLGAFRSAIGGEWVGLLNFQTVVENRAFRLAAWNTARFMMICIPLLLSISLLMALGLKHVWAGCQLRSAFLLPMAVPAASVVLVWKLLFHENGLINVFLLQLHLPSVSWMTTGASFWMLVISYLWKNLGYTIALWTTALGTIPESIYEAARMDCASEIQSFFYMTLPNLKGYAYSIGVLSLLNSFKVFREAWLVAGDYPQEQMYLVQHLYNNWFRDLSYDKIAAASVMTSAIVFALIALLRRTWEKEE